MSNTIPLPRPGSLGLIQYCGKEMQEYAAAVSAAKDAEISKLKTVMVAAAEEIQDHWDAHCDAEGYGPVNLMRRLEEGIPSLYGYTAGAFEQLRADNAALRAELAKHQESEFHPDWSMLEATRDSLAEHQQIIRELNERVAAADNAALRESLDDAESLCVAKQSEIDALRNLRHSQTERIKVLEDALRDIAYTTDGTDCNNTARAALGDKT